MNFRKRKKSLTKLQRRLLSRLKSNPFNASAAALLTICNRALAELKQEKKNVQRSKKDAKGKKSPSSFGHEA